MNRVSKKLTGISRWASQGQRLPTHSFDPGDHSHGGVREANVGSVDLLDVIGMLRNL